MRCPILEFLCEANSGAPNFVRFGVHLQPRPQCCRCRRALRVGLVSSMEDIELTVNQLEVPARTLFLRSGIGKLMISMSRSKRVPPASKGSRSGKL